MEPIATPATGPNDIKIDNWSGPEATGRRTPSSTRYRSQKDSQMETIGFLDPVRSAPAASWDTPRMGSALSRDADQPGSDFSATLLAMAGHDLRQPLQVITSAHDVLARTLASEEQREELARAGDATAQLASMLGQLVEALQLREQSGDDLHVPVSLRPMLEDLAAEFTETTRLKGITFVVAAAPGTVISHPVLLTGMLRNLIRNAIDYTPAGGGVFVTSRRCGSELRIEVRDTGVGIRANALSSIFRAFQRGDDSRPDGLGLGLFIVKHAADLLGHRVEVRSTEGRGSWFTVVANATR
jgi:two-component system phosphate regulon sensor histidine kinase PhoR